MAQTKTMWETFDFNQDQVQEQIMSTLKVLFQNISLQLYNSNPFVNTFDHSQEWSQETVSEMKNLTVSLFPEAFIKVSEDPSFQHALGETFLFLTIFLQYFITALSIFSGSWITNKFTIKSDTVTNIVETIFCLILSIPVIPLAGIFFGTLFIIRLAIYLYLKVAHQGKLSLLSPMDAFWAYESYASCSCSVGLYIVEGECNITKIQERIKNSVCSELVGGKMQKKLTSFLGFPCWEDISGELDIKDYVKVTLEGQVNTENDVFELCKSVQDIPILGRAPWETFIVPNFQYKKENPAHSKSYYAVIFRIHHSLMDGISTANVLHSCMADKPFKFSIDPLKPLGSKKNSKLMTLIIHLLGIISLPRVGLRNLFLSDNYHNKYFMPGPALSGPKTFTWTRPLKLDALKQIKNSTKTSIFAVLVTALGGAYRQLFLKNGKIPQSFIHSMSPVALLPYPDRKPKNRFTGILVPVFTGGKGLSIADRLIINHNTVTRLWSSFGNINAIANWYYPLMLGVMPLFVHGILGRCLHLKMSLSNIPGPVEDVWIFDGGKIIDIGVWVPIKLSVGLGMGVFTYGERVRATLVGDKSCFPNDSDVGFIRDAFEKELQSLASSVGLERSEDVFLE